MIEPVVRPPCPRCGREWSADAFYKTCAECKPCKRQRSKENRIAQARKVIAFERFLELLAGLATPVSNSPQAGCIDAGRPASRGVLAPETE